MMQTTTLNVAEVRSHFDFHLRRGGCFCGRSVLDRVGCL